MSFKNSRMLFEAGRAEHKFNVIINLLIFLLVFTAASSASGMLLGVPAGFSIAFSMDLNAFMEALLSGRIDVVISMFMAALPSWLIIASLYITVFNTLFSWIYCTKIEKRPSRSMGFVKKGALASYGKGLAIGLAMLCAVVGLELLLGFEKFEGVNPQISWGLIVLYFFGYVIQGMGEEVMLRGYLMMSLSNRTKPVIAVIISSVVFALLHLMNPGVTVMSIINITLIGAILGLYVFRTDNIWGACGIHTAWNFALGNIFGSAVSGMSGNDSVFLTSTVDRVLSGGVFGLEGGICSTVVFVIVLLLVIFIPQKSRSELPVLSPAYEPESPSAPADGQE